MNWATAGEIATWIALVALLITIVVLELRARRQEGWRNGEPPARPQARATFVRFEPEDEIVDEPEDLQRQRGAFEDAEESHVRRGGRAT